VLEGALAGAAIGAVSGTYAQGAMRMGATTLKAGGRAALRGVGMTLRACAAGVTNAAAWSGAAARIGTATLNACGATASRGVSSAAASTGAAARIGTTTLNAGTRAALRSLDTTLRAVTNAAALDDAAGARPAFAAAAAGGAR
jgi:hypothetical protein